MRRNRNDLDHTRKLAKKDGEGEAFQAEPAQCGRTRDRKAVRCLTNICQRGSDFGKVARAETDLLCFVVGDLLQMFGLGLRKE